MREKTVQIPESLFWTLCQYHLGEPLENEEAVDVLREIDQGLETKLQAMKRRAAYSVYKDKRLTPEQREAARQEYLDMVAMLPDYRWGSLEPPI